MSANLKDTDIVSVAVCIATYLRPQGLRKLIESVNNQKLEDNRILITLVVVDNAPNATAESTLGEIQKLTNWPVIYVVEHERGIVSARNRALVEVPPHADYIAFLDDDECVSDRWLSEMLETISLPGTVAAQGPVEPKYRGKTPDWMDTLNLFRMGPFEQGAELSSAATNNSIVDASFLRVFGLEFDPRFNFTGGEDEEFFSRLKNAGGTIRASAHALVWDDVPSNRTTLRWIARRWFRMGNTLGRIALIRRRGIATRAAKGFGAIGLGCITCLFLGFGSKTIWYRGVLQIFRGVGTIAALLQITFIEYSTSAVELDRLGDH